MSWLLILLLLIVVIGTVPRWGHSRNWGYGPSGFLGLVLVVVIVLVVTKQIHF